MSTKGDVIKQLTTTTFGPNAKDFRKDELELIDIEGLQRTQLTINFKELTDEVYMFMRDVAKSQYKIPVKYLKLIPGSYEYVSQKSALFGKDRSVKNASITIEPLNNDYSNIITYTPINQALPVGTMVELNIEVPYNGPNAKQMFFWSDNLTTIDDIENKIQDECKKLFDRSCIYKSPWIGKCHYGSIDIGSVITAKFEVDYVDTNLYSSYSLFGFSRNDELNEFNIWCYNCYNVTPRDILKLIRDSEFSIESTKSIIDEILEHK